MVREFLDYFFSHFFLLSLHLLQLHVFEGVLRGLRVLCILPHLLQLFLFTLQLHAVLLLLQATQHLPVVNLVLSQGLVALLDSLRVYCLVAPGTPKHVLVHLEVLALDDDAISRNSAAGDELHDVTHLDVFGVPVYKFLIPQERVLLTLLEFVVEVAELELLELAELGVAEGDHQAGDDDGGSVDNHVLAVVVDSEDDDNYREYAEQHQVGVQEGVLQDFQDLVLVGSVFLVAALAVSPNDHVGALLELREAGLCVCTSELDQISVSVKDFDKRNVFVEILLSIDVKNHLDLFVGDG